jgi:hypothetical protein
MLSVSNSDPADSLHSWVAIKTAAAIGRSRESFYARSFVPRSQSYRQRLGQRR